jgi:hypothetical protein
MLIKFEQSRNVYENKRNMDKITAKKSDIYGNSMSHSGKLDLRPIRPLPVPNGVQIVDRAQNRDNNFRLVAIKMQLTSDDRDPIK